MAILILVRKDSYFDSVLLMRISRELREVPGIADAAVVMGTPQNKTLLQEQGYEDAALDAAHPNDLVIAARGEAASQKDIEDAIARLLKKDAGSAETQQLPRSLAAAVQIEPDANLALISVPGAYAAREARRALQLGLHVMLFSDNVSVEDEVALKEEAVERGLLMMGPDCGTAIINGKPLGFANVVCRGSIGIVGASGTGIQEVTCGIHNLGSGVSQAIGTGGRDLSDAVGGRMTLMGIEALAADPETRVLVVISKPPSPAVAAKVIDALRTAGKPSVVHFVGQAAQSFAETPGVLFADSLAGTAIVACKAAGVEVSADPEYRHDADLVRDLAARLPRRAVLRGLFCGGTTGQEAVALLAREGIEVRSNLHKSGPLHLGAHECIPGNVVLDLGDDEFTAGRPHPMIEPELRNERLVLEMQDPGVGLVLLDCVLGYGSHPDPAGVLADGFQKARDIAASRGIDLVGIASVTGTAGDPQSYRTQVRKLEHAGVVTCMFNCWAVLLAVDVMKHLAQGGHA